MAASWKGHGLKSVCIEACICIIIMERIKRMLSSESGIAFRQGLPGVLLGHKLHQLKLGISSFLGGLSCT